MDGNARIAPERNLNAINQMSAAWAHRGPDGKGYFRGNGVALGYRRLSTIDIKGGRQPIASEDNQLWLERNGEIYNSQEMRRHCDTKGYKFPTKTDYDEDPERATKWRHRSQLPNLKTDQPGNLVPYVVRETEPRHHAAICARASCCVTAGR